MPNASMAVPHPILGGRSPIFVSVLAFFFPDARSNCADDQAR